MSANNDLLRTITSAALATTRSPQALTRGFWAYADLILQSSFHPLAFGSPRLACSKVTDVDGVQWSSAVSLSAGDLVDGFSQALDVAARDASNRDPTILGSVD